MRSMTFGRFLGALCLAGSVIYVGAAPASAAPPNWVASVDRLPAAVHNGADAGYDVTITNQGPSNISALYLVTAEASTFVGGADGAACTAPGVPLKCSFGALNAGQTVTVRVAFKTPASGASYVQKFEANTTGSTISDRKHTSHGDTLAFSATTALSADKNFGGGFAKDTSPVQDNGTVGRNNVQSTQVVPPKAGVVATVEDGLATGAFTCTGCTKTLFGEWSRVVVDNGVNQGTLFPVTLTVYGKALPKTATVDTIDLVHVLDNGSTEVLSTRCGATPALNCVSVSQVGSDYQITGWVDENGGFKGMG
jgi:hypothetical protein